MNLRIPPSSVLVAALSAVFVIVLVRTAWICDDAFITFRTVDNFVNGYGLRWNVAERVQSFTHPLWMLTFASVYAITREPYLTAIGLSVVVSLAGFVAYGSLIAARSATLLLGSVTLLCSKAFVDYSTSGLENPLTHLLLIVFVAAWLRRPVSPKWQLTLWLAVGLSLVNRQDLAVLLLAPAVWAAWTSRSWATARFVIIGMAPFVLWEVFALFYYGFPLPNTAYAKLSTGIHQTLLWRQGASYFLDALVRDPVTLLVMIAGAIAALCRRETAAIGIGIVLYALYVLSIGGDFMIGRFLSAPFVVAVGILSSHWWPKPGVLMPVAATTVLIAVSLSASPLPFATGADFGVGEPPEAKVDLTTGIDDERRWYYPDTGLLRLVGAGRTSPTHEWVQYGHSLRENGVRVTVSGFVGFVGFYAGPDVHIVDCHALTDPLLARLPASPYFRIGHFARQLPAGYLATLETGDNVIVDAELRDYYNHLKGITRGPLWTVNRFGQIASVSGGLERQPVGFPTEPSACDDIIGFYRSVLWR